MNTTNQLKTYKLRDRAELCDILANAPSSEVQEYQGEYTLNNSRSSEVFGHIEPELAENMIADKMLIKKATVYGVTKYKLAKDV